MITDSPTRRDYDAAVVGCAAYGLMAHAFRYPDNEWAAALADPHRWQRWTKRLSKTHPEAFEPLARLKVVVAGLSQPRALERLQEDFAFLFGHSVRGRCPPYELEFGQGEVIQRSSDLADISGFYAAFGMQLTRDISERPDHVSVQSEFLAVLCAKTACGIESDDLHLIHCVQNAQRQFLESHLGRWLPAFARRVRSAAPCPFYGELSDFAGAFITCECKRLDIFLGSAYLQLRPVDPDQEAAQSCGVPGECATSGGEQLTPLNVARGENS